MRVNDRFNVRHAAIIYLQCVLIEDLVKFATALKCLLISFKKNLPMFVARFALNGGLNHMIFLFLFFGRWT